MKTRDRILAASLELFNSEGEANVTALDVANVLEISPGNLYYHFKGKDALIMALFESFEAEMDVILQGSDGRLETLEDHWVFLYILLEEIYDFRFFYRSLSVLAGRYPSLSQRLHNLHGRMRSALELSLDTFGRNQQFASLPQVKSVVLDQLISTLVFWLEEEELEGGKTPPAELIHRTVLRTLLTVAPYLEGDQYELHAEMLAHYDKVLR